MKGKIRYLSPEQVACGDVDRRADLWAAAVVLWEALTGKRLFSGDCDAEVLSRCSSAHPLAAAMLAPEVPEALARVVMRGLSRDRALRFATALEMATALEEAVGLLPPREIGAWVERLAHARLEARRQVLDDIEAETVTAPATPAASQAFAAITDAAMVRESTAAERSTVARPRARRRARRSPGRAAAPLVVFVAGGAVGRSSGGPGGRPCPDRHHQPRATARRR